MWADWGPVRARPAARCTDSPCRWWSLRPWIHANVAGNQSGAIRV